MAGAIYTLIAFIIGCYLLRWSYLSFIKRERVDMTNERKQFQEDIVRALRVNRRLTQRLWNMSGWRPK